jgi:hypothetical protein
VGFVVDKVALGQILLGVLRFSPATFNSTGAPLQGKTKKPHHLLSIFLIGLHNKPSGCGASVASAAGPFNKESNTQALTDKAKPRKT